MITPKTHTLHLKTYIAWIFTDTPLALITTLNNHVYLTQCLVFMKLITWMPQPSPLKRISSRDSEAEDD
jgi:hypothetical protein